MRNLFPRWTERNGRRRVFKSSYSGLGFEEYENRVLLSGVALYPQPATSAEVAPAAVPPADFSGTWDMVTPEGSGTAMISQEGKFLEIGVDAEGEHVDFKGKVKGETAKAKFNFVVSGVHIKGKMTVSLTGPDSMEGQAKVNVVGFTKVTLPLTGTRVV